VSSESLTSPGKKLSLISIPNGVLETLRTTVLFPLPEEEKATSLQGVCYLCVGGVVLSSLITKGMMILSGTWDEECERYQEEILGSEKERNRTAAGIALWSTMIGRKVGSK
jgi:hypothetical protein